MKQIIITLPPEDVSFVLAVLSEMEENGHVGENGFSVKVEEHRTTLPSGNSINKKNKD